MHLSHYLIPIFINLRAHLLVAPRSLLIHLKKIYPVCEVYFFLNYCISSPELLLYYATGCNAVEKKFFFEKIPFYSIYVCTQTYEHTYTKYSIIMRNFISILNTILQKKWLLCFVYKQGSLIHNIGCLLLLLLRFYGQLYKIKYIHTFKLAVAL